MAKPPGEMTRFCFAYFPCRLQLILQPWADVSTDSQLPGPRWSLPSACSCAAIKTYRPLDVERMKEAAGYLVGEHDFASFCSAGSQVKDTVRTIYRLDLKKEGDLISFQVEGNGFLYNMVRIIAGTLIEAGLGSYLPEKVEQMLLAKERSKCGPKAPACGLTLVQIRYL